MFFFNKTALYLFEDGGAIFRMTDIHDIKFNEFQDVACLLDIEPSQDDLSPLFESNLFLLQATSPNPRNTEWTKQRYDTVTFVLNPSDIEEIIEASVFYSLFIPPVTLILSDYLQAFVASLPQIIR